MHILWKNLRHSLIHSSSTCLSGSWWPRSNEHVNSYMQNPQSKWSWSLILKMIWSLFKMWSFRRSDQNQKKDLDLWSWSLKKWSYQILVTGEGNFFDIHICGCLTNFLSIDPDLGLQIIWLCRISSPRVRIQYCYFAVGTRK